MNVILWVLVFFTVCGQSHGYLASFYGDSYSFYSLLHTPSRLTTNVLLRFQTKSPDGILLYATGDKHYLLVQLKNGFIEIKLCMGENETVLHSAESVALNDLLWHEVSIIRDGRKIKMTVNGRNEVSANIPANEQDGRLKINYGVFLGGYGGNASYPHVSGVKKFYRGCLLHAKFNEENVLDPLTDIAGSKVVYNVKNGCSGELTSSRSDAIQLLSPNSFVSFKKWTLRKHATFECQIKTTQEKGIIMYNQGKRRSEFIGLELVDGALRAAVNKGGGVVGLHSPITINDGHWHSIKFSFSPTSLEMRVDANRTKAYVEEANLGSDRNPYNLELVGNIYVGGIDPSLKKQAHRSLISLTGHSGVLFGCLKNIRINSRRKGLEDAIVSHDIGIGCKKLETRINSPFLDPALAHSKISELIALEFDQSASANSIEEEFVPVYVLPSFEVILNPTEVIEGERVTLGSHHIGLKETLLQPPEVVFTTFNMSQALIVNIKKAPKHGSLVIGDKCDGFRKFEVFYNDLLSKMLTYCHDGSENHFDSLKFELQWDISRLGEWDRAFVLSQSGLDANEPIKVVTLNNRTVYTAEINVTPIDDPPSLTIPINYLFEPISNAKTLLPRNIFNSEDTDSDAKDVFYNLLVAGDNYFIEKSSDVGAPVYSFAQQDIDSEDLYFVHTGEPVNSRMFFRLSSVSPQGGVSRSPDTVVVRFTTVPLHIYVSMPSEASVTQGSSMILTRDHLSINSSANEAIVSLVVNLTNQPMFGHIQRKSDREWNTVYSFTNEDLQSGHVRYYSYNTSNAIPEAAIDKITFVVEGASVTTETQELNIEVKKVMVDLLTTPLSINNGRLHTTLNLNVTVDNYYASKGQIQLKLVALPTYLDLYYVNGLLITDEMFFTLEEVDSGHVVVKVKSDVATEEVNENIVLHAIVANKFNSHDETIEVSYSPDLKTIQITNTGLTVAEGQEVVVSSDMLSSYFIQSPGHLSVPKYFVYDIIKPPQHGKLQLRNDEDYETVDAFTSFDIAAKNLYYIHDDSETTSDSFNFRVSPILDGEIEEVKSVYRASHSNDTFHIEIELLNDEQPYRVVDKPFDIARHSSRLLTRNDLWYSDKDTNFDELDLKYIRRGISNGEIVNATSRKHEKLFEFTQRDIINNQILFRHKKSDFGRFVFWVRDGKQSSTGLFVVNAGDPQIKMRNNSKLLVQKYLNTTITTENIYFVANTESQDQNIIYRITKPVKHGVITVNGVNDFSSFTQQDVIDGNVVYTHRSEIMEDIFHFSVEAHAASNTGNVTVKIFLKSQQEPPAILRNNMLVVDQGESVLIRKQDLRSSHKDSRASELIFDLVVFPRYGMIASDFTEVVSFTQSQINKGVIRYHQSGDLGNAVFTNDDRIIDSFVVDLTNGVMRVPNITINVDIVPLKIPLHVGSLKVIEGRSKAILLDQLAVRNPHFKDDIEIVITTPPKHGYFESLRDKGEHLTQFPLRLVVVEFLYYTHDDSDSTEDFVSLQAISRSNQTSDIRNLTISVIPLNDEPPVIVNNTGLDTWVDSVTTITSTNLTAFDADTPPSNLTYTILPPSNGWIGLQANPLKPILNFTQFAVNNGDVVFVHDGAETGGFSFQVDDGENFDTKHIFVIRTQPLVINVERNKPVTIFPVGDYQLSSDLFSLNTNDKLSRSIEISIVESPRLFDIIYETNDNIVESFTQMDVHKGNIWFKLKKEIDSWSAVDRIEVEATSFPAKSLEHVIISLNITYDAYALTDRKSPAVTNNGLQVIEGGNTTITLEELDSSNLIKKRPAGAKKEDHNIKYTIEVPPRHGMVTIDKSEVSMFTHKQLKNEMVVYQHDDSEGDMDEFEIEFCLWTKAVKKVPHSCYRDIIHVQVATINDNPPLLTTKGKALKVVDGFEKILLQTELQALDVDNDPRDIIFTLVQPPLLGRLIFNDNDTIDALQFTQYDIDQGRLSYRPHERAQPITAQLVDAIYFSVTDGIHKPIYSLFQAKIMPIVLNCEPEVIEMEQGDFSVALSTKLMNATTNGDCSLIRFTIIKKPEHGVLLHNKNEVTSFLYTDLLGEKIVYAMTDVQYSKDKMTILCQYHLPNNTTLNATAVLHISVKTLFNPPVNMEVSNNGLTRLTINAYQLQKKTNSVPIFTVRQPPMYGQILKVEVPQQHEINSEINSESGNIVKREVPELLPLLKNTSQFTQSELDHGFVFIFVPDIGVNKSFSVEDSFIARLSISSEAVQPSIVTIPFSIVNQPPNDYTDFFQSLIQHEATTESSEYNYATTNMMNTTLFKNIFDETTQFTTTTEAVVVEEPLPAHDRGEVVKEASSVKSWLLPFILAACSIGIILLMIIALVVQYKRGGGKTTRTPDKKAKREPAKEANEQAEGLISNTQVFGGTGRVTVTSRRKPDIKSQTCPTCPGVTITPLLDYPDLADSGAESLYNDEESLSAYIPTSTAPESTIMDKMSYEFPSQNQVYHYEDTGSFDPLNDPDIMALYSSDESLPSQLGLQADYASNYATGSMPAGLDQGGVGGVYPSGRVSNGRSTASLPRAGVNAQLTLSPNAVESHYWV